MFPPRGERSAYSVFGNDQDLATNLGTSEHTNMLPTKENNSDIVEQILARNKSLGRETY